MLARRGAHFTFDAESFRRFVISLSSTDSSIAFPTFSHAAKDPVEGGHVTHANRIMWVVSHAGPSYRIPRRTDSTP